MGTLGQTRRMLRASLAALLLLQAAAASAEAASPLETVREAMGKAVSILNGSASDGEKRIQLRREVGPYVDFLEIAHRALGRHRSKASPAERAEFEKLFVELLEQRYLTGVLFAEGRGVQVAYLGERVDGNFATVETRFATAKGGDHPVAWRLYRVGGAWKVYDMVAEGVSLVQNYRSQFNHRLAKQTFPELLAEIRAKLGGAAASQ